MQIITQHAEPNRRPKHDSFFVEQLLGSCMSKEEVLATFQRMEIPSENRYFYVSLLTPINLLICAKRENLSRYDLFHMAASQIGTFCGSHANDTCWALSGTVPSNVVILFSIDGALMEQSRANSDEKIRSILQKIMDTCNICGLTWQAYTSHPTGDYDALHAAYDQARELMAAAVMLGLSQQNLSYEDLCIPGSEINTPEYMKLVQQQENRFWTALSRNDFKKAQELLHEIIDIQFQPEHLNIQCVSSIFYALLNKVRCAIDCMRLFAGPDAFDAFDTAPRILYRKSLNEVRIQIDVIFDTYYHDKSKSPTPPPWLTRLEEYIEQNYCDSNLNVATAADQFGLNPAYASRMYKRFYGCSILEQINRLRIQRGKELMQENRLLKDIAQELGYDNPQRMNRAFHKYTGVTPKEYMEQHQTLGV